MRARVAELFSACEAGNLDGVRAMHVFRADTDPGRRWQAPLRVEDDPDHALARATCAALGTTAPTMTGFASETEREGTWLVGEVTLARGKAFLAFLAIDGVLLLGDVD